MRVVTRRTAYPAIVGVTFAAEDAIRLEADAVHAYSLRSHDYLLGAAMTGAAKVLGQFIAAEPRRVEYLILILQSLLTCGDVLGAWAVTRLASDSGRQFLQM